MTGQRAITGLAVIAMMLVSLSPAFAGTANRSGSPFIKPVHCRLKAI